VANKGSRSAILWDLDGTLVDSASVTVRALRRALESLGHDASGLDPTVLIGPPLSESLRARGLLRDDIESVRAAYLKEFLEWGIGEIRPFPGVVDLLGDVRQEGIAQAVVTNRLSPVLRQIILATALDSFFTVVCGRRNSGETKRDVILIALKHLKTAPSRDIILVGDRQEDVVLGKSFDLKTIAVRWGYSAPDVPHVGADFVASTVEDLRESLRTGFL
jgi:phosphoglycolate phosphatase